MVAALDLTGMKFGKLTAVRYIESRNKLRIWLCDCECGRQAEVTSGNLRSGNSTACGGCRVGNRAPIKHGHTSRIDGKLRTSPTYQSWRSMRARPKAKEKARWYAGVDIDPRWEEFDAFLADMGERPDGMTLDRIDREKGYSRENCRWATPTEQTRNRRCSRLHTEDGMTKPLAEWAVDLGLSYSVVSARIRRYNSVRLPERC